MNVSSLTSVGMNNRDSLQPISLQPLATALSNGNLTSAKVAFNNIIGKIPPRGPQPPVTLDNKKATNIDWKPLAISIYAGDLSGAQNAFTQISNSLSDSQVGSSGKKLPTGPDGIALNLNGKQPPTGPSGIPTTIDGKQLPTGPDGIATNLNGKQPPTGPTGIPISEGFSVDSSLDFTI